MTKVRRSENTLKHNFFGLITKIFDFTKKFTIDYVTSNYKFKLRVRYIFAYRYFPKKNFFSGLDNSLYKIIQLNYKFSRLSAKITSESTESAPC